MVQTFLPYVCIRTSLQVLDSRRLQKQSVEAFQIYLNLIDPTRKGFKNHPVVKMWRDYIPALRLYICEAVYQTSLRLTKAGIPYKTTKMTENIIKYNIALSDEELKNFKYPDWWGRVDVHGSHQAMLYRKGEKGKLDNYKSFAVAAPYFDNYVWPC